MNPTNSECLHLRNSVWEKCNNPATHYQTGTGIPLCTDHAQALQKCGAKIKRITPKTP